MSELPAHSDTASGEKAAAIAELQAALIALSRVVPSVYDESLAEMRKKLETGRERGYEIAVRHYAPRLEKIDAAVARYLAARDGVRDLFS